MNPDTLRSRILDYTKREMSLHGTNRLTMDDIAKGMKMSKRTLYKLFPSKVCLFRVCLSDLANEIRRSVQQKQIRMDSSCMGHLFIIVNGYLTLLHSMGKTLLLDIAEDDEYRSSFERENTFWLHPTGFARNTVCPSSSPDRTRAKAILNIRPRKTAPVIRRS